MVESNNNKYIIHIGPDYKMKGGMHTVINNILNSQQLSEYNFKFIATSSTEKKYITFLKGLLTMIDPKYRFKIKLAHIHMASKGSFYRKSIVILLLHSLRIPCILHLHGGNFQTFYSSMSWLMKKYCRYVLRRVNKFIVLTRSWKDFLLNHFDINEVSIKIIGNCVKIPTCEKGKITNNQTVKILYLGRLVKQKGIYDLIEAANELKQCNYKFKMILGGSGDEQKCLSLIQKYELEDNVILVGWLDEIEKDKYLQDSDILVLPSYYESFGISLIEGMSYGLPIVSSYGGQMVEVARENVDGIFIHPGNISELKNALGKLIDDENLRNKYGSNGYSHVINNYSEEIIMIKYKKLYDEVMKDYCKGDVFN
jgi:glycosyltransferase involved in cell wall biosynthesis